ncbi:MAG: FkbM family methyltransferase [Methylocystis sp.]
MLDSVANLSRLFTTHPLTRDAPMGAWARFASWQLRSRLQEEVVHSWIAGQRLAIRRGMKGATGNIYVGLQEFEDMMFPLHFLREGDLFLDIGANVGTFTVLASGVCGAATWAFEPDPNTSVHLKRNIEINKLDALVTVHQCALGPVEAEVPFTIGLDCTNKVLPAGEKDARIVHQEPLDNLVGAARPIMIKMDVEGYEEDVLKGARALLANPCLMVVELETVNPGIEQMMLGAGFEEVFYDPFTRALKPEPIGQKPWNSLFIRDRSVVEERLATAKRIEVLGQSI